MFPRHNNLEWLRLLFATQVLIVHAGHHLGMVMPTWLEYFPGVPAFFFVSGFLIYASYKNSPGTQYFANRFLRLFPGLVLVTLGGMAVALVARGWSDLIENAPTYLIWVVSQITLGQAYNPGLFRDFGVGVINGSLWTITTEILFYLSVPLIVWCEKYFRWTVLVLTAASFVFYAAGPFLFEWQFYRDKTLYDAIALTPIAWGWMFGFGILAVKHFALLRPLLRYLPIAVIPMGLMILFGEGVIFGAAGNRLGVAYFATYVAMVLWVAFATPYLRLSFDLSYGVYVWHMPIINLLIVLAIPTLPAFAGAVLLTFAIAAFSWFLVEKPALKLKRRSLKPIESAGVAEAAPP